MAVSLSTKELKMLQEEDPFLMKLYVLGIRQHMDYETGITGIKRRISWQSLAEECFVSPRSGIKKMDTGLPKRPRLQRAIATLQRMGLIAHIKNPRHLIFECLLATSDQSVQKQVDQGADQEVVPPQEINKPITMQPTERISLQADQGFRLQADPPPNTDSKKEKELLRSSKKKKEIKRRCQIPDDFCVTENHERLAMKNGWPNPFSEIEQFRHYHKAKGSLMLSWDSAFYTWLGNAKKFKERTHGNTRKTNSITRAVQNYINIKKGEMQ